MGLNIAEGKIVYEDVADAFDMEYTSIDEVL
jgi:alanine dehydrogenase